MSKPAYICKSPNKKLLEEVRRYKQNVITCLRYKFMNRFCDCAGLFYTVQRMSEYDIIGNKEMMEKIKTFNRQLKAEWL